MKSFVLAIAFLGVLFNVEAQEPLQRGFRAIQLGISQDQAGELLIEDPSFLYRGQPDVSIALTRNEPVIDTRGAGFVSRGLLQFTDDRLYILTLYLNQQQLDYFVMYEQLRERYGEPQELDPQRSLWDDGRTRIELERPLTIRYIDLDVFEQRRQERRTLRATQAVTREEFLQNF